MQRLTSQSTDSSGWLSAGWVTDDQEEEEEVVYEEVGPRRPPVPLPRSRGGATSPDM